MGVLILLRSFVGFELFTAAGPLIPPLDCGKLLAQDWRVVVTSSRFCGEGGMLRMIFAATVCAQCVLMRVATTAEAVVFRSECRTCADSHDSPEGGAPFSSFAWDRFRGV